MAAAAFVDEELKRLLISKLADERDLIDAAFGRNGPISSFSARIDFAMLLGLLSRNEGRDLHLLRKIRNDFAHSPDPLSFTDQTVQRRCLEFFHTTREPTASPRQHFTSTVSSLLAAIHASIFRADRLTVPHGFSREQMANVRGSIASTLAQMPSQAINDIAEQIVRASEENVPPLDSRT